MAGKDPRFLQHRRDVGLGRVRTMSGWVAAGALALTAVLSAAVATSLPGRTTTSSQRSTPSGGASSPTSLVPSSGSGLQAPTQAPAPATQTPSSQTPAPVVSGGS